MRTLEAVVAALLDGEDAPQVRAVLGDTSAGEVTESWHGLVRRHLGTEILGCTYDYVSVGITLELRLADHRACVLKAWSRRRPDPRGALRVQAHLAARGFAAPAVLAAPEPCAEAWVVLMEALERGPSVRYDASIRDTMARQYARLTTLAAQVQPRPAVVDRTPDPARLWPTPHSVIFDFEATRRTATPIEALATAARERLQGRMGPSILAHCDWSLQNVSFCDGRLVGVFDWDSVFAVPEVVAVAGAAAFHQQDWRLGPQAAEHDFYPGPEPALAFAAAYVEARGRPWTAVEHRSLRAALVYALSYQARCEHALAPDEDGPARGRLVRFAEAFEVR